MERFWSKVDKSGGPDACWPWLGAKYVAGYGQLRFGKKTKSAHRMSWEIHFGTKPGDMDVCHTCDNPSCVNPAHLFLGTHLDNMRDRSAKGRYSMQPKGEAVHLAKLTKDDVLEIRWLLTQKKFSHREIAAEFSVDRTSVTAISRRKTWKHV